MIRLPHRRVADNSESGSTKACVFSNITIVQGLSRFLKKDQDRRNSRMVDYTSNYLIVEHKGDLGYGWRLCAAFPLPFVSFSAGYVFVGSYPTGIRPFSDSDVIKHPAPGPNE